MARLVGVDLARAPAVFGMFAVHVGPAPAPGGGVGDWFLGSTFTWRERLMVGALGPRGTTSIVFGLLAFNALPDGPYADTALYAMTLTVLGSVLLHGGGSVVIARSLTGSSHSAGADRTVAG